MPVVRSVASRRSRRLSTTQEVVSRDTSDDGWEWPGELLYPDSDEDSGSSASRSRLASPAFHPYSAPSSRASHGRQRPANHIPRPPNPFICFRSDYCDWNRQQVGGVRDHRLVSQLAGKAWRALDSASRRRYEEIAQEKKKQHADMYPGYAYSPSSRAGGKGRKRKSDDDCDYEERAPLSKRRKSRDSGQSLTLAVKEDCNVPANIPNLIAFTSPTTPSPSPEPERLQTPELSPNNSFESPMYPMLQTPVATSSQLLSDDDDFVPTAEIPPLDLYARAEEKDLASGHFLEPSSSFPKFFKTEISQETRNFCMWYNTDGTYAQPPAIMSEGIDDLPAIAMQFTNPFPNPFELEMEDLFDTYIQI
ncbi:hypothetical protein C8R43DRAFT_958595 [Mycena crocata]|nr:hypothetical protein C8R43DRAFT_958595 [Mycena crocata]